MDRRRISRLTLSLLLPVLAVCALLVINEVGFRRSSQALEAIAQAAQTRSTSELRPVLDLVGSTTASSLPLTMVSIFCNALMAVLGIGLKVATLPVVALGVGVGVDYGIYLFERIQHSLD